MSDERYFVGTINIFTGEKEAKLVGIEELVDIINAPIPDDDEIDNDR